MSSKPVYPLGYFASLRVLELGRAAFFGSDSADLPQGRSPLIASDDLVPSFGYVGTHFAEAGVLLLGINPGNGPNAARNRGDERLMPALHQFAHDLTPRSFVEAQQAYRAVCSTWPIWSRHCTEVIGAGRLSLDEIAYSNCLPWRTASQSGFDDSVAQQSATLYAYPLIQELKPRLILAMGKKATTILGLAGKPLPPIITWNRAQAATDAVRRERAGAAAEIFGLLGR